MMTRAEAEKLVEDFELFAVRCNQPMAHRRAYYAEQREILRARLIEALTERQP